MGSTAAGSPNLVGSSGGATDAGVDIDGVGGVRGRNTQSLNEFNPFYNSSYDEYGRRFRVDDKHTYRITIAIEGQL